jgi:hypothetical protein
LANIAPIKDDKSRVVLYLCQFKDITALKQPLDDENNKGIPSHTLNFYLLFSARPKQDPPDSKNSQIPTAVQSDRNQRPTFNESNGRELKSEPGL